MSDERIDVVHYLMLSIANDLSSDLHYLCEKWDVELNKLETKEKT